MSKWQGDGYTDEQRTLLHALAAKLPPAPCCPDESRLVRDLRGMLDAQGRVSEQHRKRVQELAGEVERLRQRSRDEDAARIRLNHARIEAEDKNARLTAQLAERDAENALYREALAWYADERNYDVDDYDHEDVPGEIIGGGIRCSRCGIKGCQAYFEPDRGKRARAALAARGGEG